MKQNEYNYLVDKVRYLLEDCGLDAVLSILNAVAYHITKEKMKHIEHEEED